MGKPILCVDFDGVLHSYTSGWKGADVIPDPPVGGALVFLCEAVTDFRVAIFSSRSNLPGGRSAMQAWLETNFKDWAWQAKHLHSVLDEIEWPTEKPPAMVTLDDRAITFTGQWPTMDSLKNFKPWNK